MLKRVLLGLLFVLTASAIAQTYRYTPGRRPSTSTLGSPSHMTKGYYRKNGEYVPPHMSTRPEHVRRSGYPLSTSPYRTRSGSSIRPYQLPKLPEFNFFSKPKAHARKTDIPGWNGWEFPDLRSKPSSSFGKLPKPLWDLSSSSKPKTKTWAEIQREFDESINAFSARRKEKSTNFGFAAAPASMVFATPSGHSYHRAGCSSLSRSKNVRSLSVQAAEDMGLKPCSRCHP